MEIANLTDGEVKKYGTKFKPREILEIDNQIVQTYSLAEISAALQSIARSLNKIANPDQHFKIKAVIDNTFPLNIRIQEDFVPEKLSLWKRLKRKVKI